jgi:hypothetical protein
MIILVIHNVNPFIMNNKLQIPKFIPVIHVRDEAQALEQAHIAFDNGADGIFLIDHGSRLKGEFLCNIYSSVRDKFDEEWIGLNFLGLNPFQATDMFPACADALWTDNQGWTSVERSEVAMAVSSYDFIHFASTAFKYQNEGISDAESAAMNSRLFDVIVTSGDATGHAASVEKIKIIKENIFMDLSPLALASGVSVANIDEFLPYVDSFMVATGISKSFHELDPKLVNQLAQKIC